MRMSHAVCRRYPAGHTNNSISRERTIKYMSIGLDTRAFVRMWLEVDSDTGFIEQRSRAPIKLCVCVCMRVFPTLHSGIFQLRQRSSLKVPFVWFVWMHFISAKQSTVAELKIQCSSGHNVLVFVRDRLFRSILKAVYTTGQWPCIAWVPSSGG